MTHPPTIVLGERPTPVERLAVPAARNLYVKRDDLSSGVYGGNKVRKLERLLGDARAAGKRRLLTIGAAGSNQLVALSVFGPPLGFEVRAVVVEQPPSARGARNLRVALAHGLDPVACASWALAPLALGAAWRPGTYVVPLGGSSVVGSLGFVDAALELAAQVAAGVMPAPDEIVVAMGSGGSAAGLAVGLEAAGLSTRVTGVAVASPSAALHASAARLIWSTARTYGLGVAARSRAMARLRVTSRYLGAGYGHASPAGDDATLVAARSGLELDATYTAKAFACALDRARAPSAPVVLFWHTLSSAPLVDPGGELPPSLARLFKAL